ncbi:MAG: transposase [Anaerovibrio sp.]|nr:transposase [Anaerovibrio sp.]
MARKAEDVLTRVEKHLIRPTSPWYAMIGKFCHLSKNLYNHANYLVRSKFIEEGLWLRYKELDQILKKDEAYPDYKAMPTAQSAQQVLRLLDKNWKSFFSAIKDWQKHKEKYLGRPKLPKYKPQDGKFILVMTNQNCKMKNGEIIFPKTFNGFKAVPAFVDDEDKVDKFATFQQVRFIPQGKNIVMEIVYTLKPVIQQEDNGRYAGIDIGVDNLLTMAVNTGDVPLIINGKIPKSVNQFYNKEHSYWQSLCMMTTGRYSSARLNRLTDKRNRRIDDYMHKASRLIVTKCVEQGISTIVIGKNKEWKQASKLSKRVNQHFVQMPFARLIQMIEYKAKEKGIAVILTEESYTSGTSFLDGEVPTKKNYDKSRRVHRGLFKANDGRKINADVNGAFQIMKKVFPNVSTDGIEDVVLRPVVVVAV